MNSYFFCCSGAVIRITGPPVSNDFVEALSEITQQPWEAAVCPETRVAFPFDDTLPSAAAFSEYVALASAWLKRPMEALSPPAPADSDPFIFVYAVGDSHGIMKGQRIWLALLQSKAFPLRIVKTYEFHEFGEQAFLEQWLAYHRRRRWNGPSAPQTIHKFLEMISPPTPAHRIPNYMAELEVLRRISLTIRMEDLPPHPVLNSAERKVLHAFHNAAPADKAELWNLKSIQATELRAWIHTLPPATYRTSDLTAQFNTHMQAHGVAPLQEVGSLMKTIGYENKRTAAGYIWPQLAAGASKPQHAPIKPADLDVGSAGLFSGL